MKIIATLKTVMFIGILIVLTSGWLSAQGNGAGNGKPANLTNAASKTEARNEYVTVLKKLHDVPAYRVQIVLTQPGFVTITTTIDYLSPDRFRFVKESDVAKIGKTKSEMIFIGKSAWIKNAAEEWQINPDGTETVAALRNPQMIEDFMKNNRIDVQPVGSEILNGQPVKVYQFTDDDGRQNIRKTFKTWVGVKDNLPQKMISQTETNVDGKTEITTLTAEYNYSLDIKIEPPIK